MIDPLLTAPLLTPAEMNAWDREAARLGLKTELLMENASREALHALAEKLDGVRGKSVLCLAGPGNNGGDAVALARHLHDAGAEVVLGLARPSGAHKGAPGFHLRLARRAGVVVLRAAQALEEAKAQPPDAVVDGLLGTGLSGDPRPDTAALIDAVNRLGQRSFVLALDIPSGLCGLTGRPGSPTVIADATVSFETAKLGLALPQASPYVGELLVRPIGIPRAVREALPPAHRLLAPELALMLPLPDPAMHKGAAGRLLVLGGSPGLTGAPFLSALGALRCGAGLVTAACPRGLEPVLKAGCPDVMTLPLGEGEQWDASMAAPIREHLEAWDALVIGPGLGRTPGAARFLEALLQGGPLPPAVWDADALFWLAAHPRRLERSVITPHPGEAARMLGLAIPEIESDRAGCVRRLAESTGAAVVLKGPASLICQGGDPSGSVYVSPFAEPNLAVGGSGDVLSGVAGSLLARGVSPLLAACLGVYWHGLAGRLVSGEFPYRGNLASEIVQALPRALTEWLDAES
ncbi:Bifunctional NAD(P)H-hydrate repair enzyme Nnr [Fundidesulfovibrio magnetotacticus]|uniref:Bifunctional NAD(P)H-hydrate repair enzyme n=2 Tax=Fundidesulfovibrio magnetotacticus TaxID=2730080 RepID=A0A6V8LRR8_9BACT|nr:Bifunctional NAD(P)H-hydrate repair enzyme Nnr [Fundidesulfovibrio magnetotacticus]